MFYRKIVSLCWILPPTSSIAASVETRVTVKACWSYFEMSPLRFHLFGLFPIVWLPWGQKSYDGVLRNFGMVEEENLFINKHKHYSGDFAGTVEKVLLVRYGVCDGIDRK